MTHLTSTPGIGKRLLSLIYEVLLLTAVVLLAGSVAAELAQAAGAATPRMITQMAVALTTAGYFAWQWHRGGQTLAMKTWRIRVETTAGARLSLPRALLRVILSAIGYGLLGITVLWALLDRDRQFLHDRLAGTRLVRAI